MDLDDFLDRLDEPDDPERESIYGDQPLDLSVEQARQAIVDGRPCGGWLALRRLAGPPGTSVPPLDDAWQRLASQDASLLDAYAILFTSPALPPDGDAPLHVVLQLCTQAGWREAGGNFLTSLMAAWSALASFVAGDVEPLNAWGTLVLDGEPPPPGFEGVLPLLDLATQPDLLGSVSTRRAVAGHWRGPPAIPELPAPRPGADEQSRGDWSRAIEALGDAALTKWADEGLRQWSMRIAERLESHPVIAAVRQACLEQSAQPPDVDALPSDIESWLLIATARRENAAARLGGLLAWRAGEIPGVLLTPLLLGDLREEDLPLLIEVAPAEVASMYTELQDLLPRLPTTMRRDMVVMSSPMHPENIEAAARLAPQITVLEQAAATAGGEWLRQTIGWLQSLQNELPAPGIPDSVLEGAVQALVTQLPRPTEVTSDQLRAVVAGAPVPKVDAQSVLGLVDPWSRLIGALLLRRTSSEVQEDARAQVMGMLADIATRAIMDIGSVLLFDLRLELLEEVIATAPNPVERLRAKIAMANTISGLSTASSEGWQRAVGLFDQAVGEAERIGDPDLYANAIAMWARSLRHGGLDDPLTGRDLRTRALELLDRALALDLDDEIRSKTLFSKAVTLGHPGPRLGGADAAVVAPLMEEAIRLSPVDRWRFDMLRECAGTWLAAGQTQKAEACLRECLGTGKEHLLPVDLGLVHAELGRVLGSRHPRDAEAHLRQALRLSSSTTDWGFCALRLAEFLHTSGRSAEALDLIRKVADDRSRLPASHAGEMWRLKMVLEHSAGETRLAEEARDAALRQVKGTVDEAIVCLIWAEFDATAPAALRAALDYVAGASGAESTAADQLAAALLTHHMSALDADTCARLLTWARARDVPFLEAVLWEAQGDPDTALARIDAALAGADRDKELRLRVLRLAVLPKDPPGELRQELDRIQTAAASETELPLPALCDYATACRLAAHGEPGWLDRAIRAWAVAHARSPAGSHYRSHIATGWVVAVRDRIKAAALASEPGLAPLLHALLPVVDDLTTDTLRPVFELLGMVLLPGALTHPALQEAASTLLKALPPHPWLTEFAARLTSIRAVQQDPGTSIWSLPSELGATTPFDDHPHRWLVAAAAGISAEAPPREIVADAVALRLFCQIRPDRADIVLAAAATVLGELDAEAQDGFVTAAIHVIQEAPLGEGVWPGLTRTAKDIPAGVSGRARLLHHLRRARMYSDEEPDQNAEPPPNSAWSLQEGFDEAVRLMDLTHRSPAEAAVDLKTRAIAMLSALVQEHGALDAAGCLISLGNAHRLEPDADLEKALACYARVAALGDEIGPHELGRLHKVWSDALRTRGRDEDLEEAWRHIQAALSHRREGRLRAETLLSAALIARDRPGRTAAERARQSCALLVEGTRCSPDGMRPFLDMLLGALTQWCQCAPESFAASGVVSEISQRYPHLSERLTQSASGLSQDPFQVLRLDPDLRGELAAFYEDPSGLLYFNSQVSITRVDRYFDERHAPGLGEGFEPQAAMQHLRDRYIGDDSDALGQLADSLLTAPEEARTGALVLRVDVLAQLARLGAVKPAEVRTATTAALDAVRAGQVSKALGAFFLDRLAKVWAPDDTVSDPVCDFDLAVELATAGVELAGGEESAGRDNLVALARALRHRGGDRAGPDLTRAKQLYEKALEFDRGAGSASSVANTLHMLADVVGYVGDGDQTERLKHVARLEREAVDLASSREMRARYQGNLAWTLSRLAAAEPNQAEAERLFREVDQLFEDALEVATAPAHRANVIQNRETARSMRAQRLGDLGEAIEIGRSRLASLDADVHPETRAKAQHNLADTLSRSSDLDDVREGLRLMRSALRYRTPDRVLRQHWESAIGVAEALLHLADLHARMSRSDREEALAALRGAAAAARELGAGTEAHRVAMDLMRLALHTPALRQMEATAEESWELIRHAMPYLLTDHQAAESEGRAAMMLCFLLADASAKEGLVGSVAGGWALSAERSALVLRWWLRAEAAWRRRRRALLESPADVPDDQVLAWRRELRRGDAVSIVQRLHSIHERAPGWLTEDVHLTETRRWLAAHRAVGIGVWPGDGGFLVAVVGAKESQDRVLLLNAPMVPLDESQLALGLRDIERRAELIESVVQWVNQSLMQRLRQYLGRPPQELLWCPHGVLRLVPPGMLFGAIPVSVCASLSIGVTSSRGKRPDRALVVVAEPESAPMGPETIDLAAALASGMGGGRLIAARGASWGPDVHPSAMKIPPTAQHVLRELDDSSLAVILAHGHMSGPDEAWIHLLHEDGSEDRLDVRRLGEDPQVIAGLRVVLLSCETGRTGDLPNMPGGMAGALLAAGAAEVVAPLWSVSVPSALRLGQALTEGVEKGKSLASTLASFRPPKVSPGPQLGRVSKARRAAAVLDHAAFVTWVG